MPLFMTFSLIDNVNTLLCLYPYDVYGNFHFMLIVRLELINYSMDIDLQPSLLFTTVIQSYSNSILMIADSQPATKLILIM